MTGRDGGMTAGIARRRGRLALGTFVCGLTLALIVACDGAAAPTAAPEASATLAPALQRGEQVYLQYCNACHPGGHRGAGPNLAGRVDAGEVTQTVRQGKRNMPAFGPSQISDADLQSLIGYIQTLK
jgi:mono/diheme cytochrome c family protein